MEEQALQEVWGNSQGALMWPNLFFLCKEHLTGKLRIWFGKIAACKVRRGQDWPPGDPQDGDGKLWGAQNCQSWVQGAGRGEGLAQGCPGPRAGDPGLGSSQHIVNSLILKGFDFQDPLCVSVKHLILELFHLRHFRWFPAPYSDWKIHSTATEMSHSKDCTID